jgi:SAM-dependent methyltransferase
VRAADTGLPVPREIERSAYQERDEWIKSGRFALDLLARSIGRPHLQGVDLLDVGCGTKLAKVMLDESLPLGHYTGVDVAPEVIEWLRANVSDPRFDFWFLDAHNARYNPGGKQLAGFDLLPVGPRRYDLISLFSVFTHLAPPDFVSMLRLLRRHIKRDGTLLFSLYIADPENPTPLDLAAKERLSSNDPAIRAEAEAELEKNLEEAAATDYDPRFSDVFPEDPMLMARYQKDYAVELFEGTGWEIETINPPERYIQHYIVSRPA